MAQSQKPFYFALGIVLVAGAVFVGQKLRRGGPISIPANVTVVPSDTLGFRGYLLTSTDVSGVPLTSGEAPVEVTEYADFQCPACQQFATVQFPDVRQRLIATGKATLRFRDFPLDDIHSHPREAAHAAACANDQGKFWQVAEGIFERQMEWSPLTNPIPVLKEIVVAAGGDGSKWTDCMEAKTYAGRIQASVEEANALGVTSTPTFLIAGRLYSGMSSDEMVRIVDSIIASRKPVTGTPSKP